MCHRILGYIIVWYISILLQYIIVCYTGADLVLLMLIAPNEIAVLSDPAS